MYVRIIDVMIIIVKYVSTERALFKPPAPWWKIIITVSEVNHTYFYVKGYNIHENSVNNTNISIGLTSRFIYYFLRRNP